MKATVTRPDGSVVEITGDADIVDDETTGLVLEDAVHAGDRLSQVVAPHRFVDIHGVAARGVESGEPHVADDDELERVGRVFEAFLQFTQ